MYEDICFLSSSFCLSVVSILFVSYCEVLRYIWMQLLFPYNTLHLVYLSLYKNAEMDNISVHFYKELEFCFIFNRLSLGVIAYGISFGIKKFSGSFFLNLFLFAIASIPSKSLSIFLQNK